MAKLEPMGIVGRIDNIIHYKMGNRFYVRSTPRKFKQTKATKLRAGEFGRASSMGCSIRAQLSPVMPETPDRKMRGRLVGVIFQWLSGLSTNPEKTSTGAISSFSFTENKHTVLDRWKVALQVKNPAPGLVQIHIPAFVPDESVKAPTGSVSVLCRMATGVCDVKTGAKLGGSSTELVFAFNGRTAEAQTISMKLPTPKGSLIVTGASLEYRMTKNGYMVINTNKDHKPAGIIAAIFTGL